MRKILITGGAGYVGSKLVLALKGAEVFDTPQNIVYGYSNGNELEKAIEGKDIVYHLAALAELSYTDKHPKETYQVNIEGTNNVCELCAKHNVLLNFISTCCIYGEPLELPSKEDGLINPTDTYAMSKAAGEYLVKMWHLSKGLRYNILRLGTVYGPSTNKKMRGDMCVQKFLEAAAKGKPLTIQGSGKQVRNFIHIDDLTRALVAVTEKRIEGETINIAGKERVTIQEIAWYARKMGSLYPRKKKKEIIFKFKPERKDDFRNQDIYIGKAQRILNWQPKIRFMSGVQEFYRWVANIHN